MQTANSAAENNEPQTHAEPLRLTKRIASTTFEVSVHFSETSRETMEDKILRLIMREVKEGA